MAVVIKRMLAAYKYAIDDLADKRLEHLPLIKTPIPIIAILVLYLAFVLKWGPQFMKNRKPFTLKKTLVVYNLLQMISCFIFVAILIPDVKFNLWYCNPAQPDHLDPVSFKYSGYAYFIMKIVDLLDTVFFILKKNYRQVTVLHLYHHTLMVVCVWFCAKYYPTGHAVYIPLINMIVHFIMYGYYLLTVYDEKYKKSVWWKKHITQIQLVQFGLCFIIYGVPIFNGCDKFPRFIFYYFTFFNLIMTTLFSNFYYQNYIKKKDK